MGIPPATRAPRRAKKALCRIHTLFCLPRLVTWERHRQRPSVGTAARAQPGNGVTTGPGSAIRHTHRLGGTEGWRRRHACHIAFHVLPVSGTVRRYQHYHQAARHCCRLAPGSRIERSRPLAGTKVLSGRVLPGMPSGSCCACQLTVRPLSRRGLRRGNPTYHATDVRFAGANRRGYFAVEPLWPRPDGIPWCIVSLADGTPFVCRGPLGPFWTDCGLLAADPSVSPGTSCVCCAPVGPSWWRSGLVPANCLRYHLGPKGGAYGRRLLDSAR